jgi:hypothetical protein
MSATLIKRLRKLLKKRGKSISKFVVEAAQDYVNSASEPGDIELQGNGSKRIFKGQELFWEETTETQTGVFLTAKGKLVFWYYCPRATNQYEQEEFAVYDDLDELFETQDWLSKKQNQHIKTEILANYKTGAGRLTVERLDI